MALFILLLFAGCTSAGETQLAMPELDDADYYWIASRIFENETNRNIEYLTAWNTGEDFPSMGIGHFIWFPEGVDAPFDESFPRMLSWVRERSGECAPVPEWLAGDVVPPAPWPDKATFDASYDDEPMQALRTWLARTAPQQSQYIVASFQARWNALDPAVRADLTPLVQRLLSTSQGLFAVIDYFNFKGLGTNPRERYAGEGWGLLQVLADIAPEASDDDAELVREFSEAAAARLSLRVENAPPERNEARWIPGWHRRVGEYQDVAPALAEGPVSAYRVRPYLQAVDANEATVAWFSEKNTTAVVTVDGITVEQHKPELACELGYHLVEYANLENARFPPWAQSVTLSDLAPGVTYVVHVKQDGEEATVEIRTPDVEEVHFVVYADSETEPESKGSHAPWTQPGGDADRRYLVDQADGYAANLALIAQNKPDFIAIAGDLVESGGEQRDWDEFWRANEELASSSLIVPALGNHDYFGGPRSLGGYGAAGSERALGKYQRYFRRDQYYSLDYGPVSLIVVDANNAGENRTDTDTNWYLDGTAALLKPGSKQWTWLETELARAQEEKAFTFVMFHPAPYTSGTHGLPPGTGDGQNFSSGVPLQMLTELFTRYGVDAVFNGHDELYEHSVVAGTEQLTDGSSAEHAVHFFTVGIGGDGLRGPDALVQNPYSVFLAHKDAPEVWEEGVLVSGGKHYGHLEVRVERVPSGRWLAILAPVYVVPAVNEQNAVIEIARHIYEDDLVLESRRVD